MIYVNAMQNQIDELARVYAGVQQASEGGTTFFLLPSLELPEGIVPRRVDALLCPTPRDGYPSRLYYGEPIQNTPSQFQNPSTSFVLGRNWHTCSWRVQPGLRLVQTVRAHLDALKRPA